MTRRIKAAMTSRQIIIIVLLLISFVFLMLIFPTVLNQDEIDRAVCHQSVILRMTLPDFLDIKDLPSLKCQTRKVCITDKAVMKGDCDDDLVEDYDTVRVSKSNREEEINAFVARELADCWSMMGEGKGQIFTSDLRTKERCSVCTRIAFDKDLKNELKEVKGLGDYLLSRKVPNTDQRYWDFLTDRKTIYEYDKSLDIFSTKEKVIVFLEIERSSLTKWLPSMGLGTVGAFGFMIPVIGLVVGPVTTVGGIFIGWVGGGKVADVVSKEYRSGWAFVDYNSRDLKGLGCTSFENII